MITVNVIGSLNISLAIVFISVYTSSITLMKTHPPTYICTYMWSLVLLAHKASTTSYCSSVISNEYSMDYRLNCSIIATQTFRWRDAIIASCSGSIIIITVVFNISHNPWWWWLINRPCYCFYLALCTWNWFEFRVVIDRNNCIGITSSIL